MIGFSTIASPEGFIIGLLIGFIPLTIGFYFKQYRAAVLGFIACVLSGFACGFLGGVPAALGATAIVVSYAYAHKHDPYTSRASLDEVSFEETFQEYMLRQMSALGRFLRSTWHTLTRNKGGFIGFLGILFFVCMSAFGPLFIEYEGRPQMSRRQDGQMTLYRQPCVYIHGLAQFVPAFACEDEQFPLGLDWQGRSILSHIVWGGQNLIITSVQAGLLSTLIAVALGSLAGLLGGWVDQGLSALSNFILTIPQFPLLLVLASIMSFSSNWMLAILLALLTWPVLMRAVRAQVLSLKARDYVEAAVALDLGLWHIIRREVLPNMISYIAINMIFAVRAAMYALVGLVILGMVPLTEPDWGVMIWNSQRQGAFFNQDAMWMALAPITAIALFQLSLVLFTRSLEEIFNPRLRSDV